MKKIYQLNDKYIQRIEKIFIELSSKKGSSINLSILWFNVIMQYLQESDLEVVPRGTLQKYLDLISDK